MTLPILLFAAALPVCLPVEGERVTAADLAQANGVFAALPPETGFGYAPAPGARRILGSSELKRLAAPREIAIEAGTEICVTRALEPLNREALLPAMKASLANPEARIEIVEMSGFGAPRGEIEFPLTTLSRPPLNDPGTAVLWKGFVRYGARRRYPLWARVRIATVATRVVAETALAAGQPIEEGQVRLETSEGFPLAEAAASRIEDVAGRVPRRAIAAGAIVPLRLLADAPDIRRGEQVRLRAVSGSAQVQVQGRAESNGSRGGPVLVRNMVSGKTVRARVVGKGAAAVEADK